MNRNCLVELAYKHNCTVLSNRTSSKHNVLSCVRINEGFDNIKFNTNCLYFINGSELRKLNIPDNQQLIIYIDDNRIENEDLKLTDFVEVIFFNFVW